MNRDTDAALRGRFLQFHPTIAAGDAVGNEILAVHRLLKSAGLRAVALAAGAGREDGVEIRSWRSFRPHDGDTLVLHYSLGHEIYEELVRARCRRLLVYHNITPPELLAGAPPEMIDAARRGLDALPVLAAGVESAAAHSTFSASGFEALTGAAAHVLPYLANRAARHAPPAREIIDAAPAGVKTLLAVGRLLPHKRIKECFMVFDYLRRFSARRWRLVVAGDSSAAPAYVRRLEDLIGEMELSSVTLAGRVSDAALNAWYLVADALLSMSEHEGFCVPLVEAMRFGVPVFCRAAGAVTETLAGGGMCFEVADWPAIAEAIDAVAEDPVRRAKLISAQQSALLRHDPGFAAREWMRWLTDASRPVHPSYLHQTACSA